MADSCNSDNILPYDLNLHIAACFIVMGCSFLGTMIPIVGKKLAGKKNSLPLVCGKLFGSGVILSTALIHMFVPADQALTNPCVPKTFAEDYTGFAGLFCLLGILFIHLIQTLVSREMRRIHLNRLQSTDLPTIDEKSIQKVEEGKTQPEGEHHHDGHHHHHGDHEGHNHHGHGHGHAHGHAHGLILSVKEKHVSTYMLELGVASHSIIVGLTLGVAREEFKTLLVALTLHQFFEGLALSSVVLDSDFQKKIATIFMVTFYALTTPIGIAIGIGISNSYQESSSVSLLTSGILDAISAGILLYDGLINILGTHFSSEQFSKTSGWKQAAQLFSLWLGAAAMAIVGRWA